MVLAPSGADPRWQLYRLLGEPARLQILALAGQEELSVGELATVLQVAQPSLSRHARLLRDAGLLTDRRDGTRTFIRLASGVAADPILADALAEGTRLSRHDGSMERLPAVLAAREADTREFFRRARTERGAVDLARELPAYLFALSPLLPRGGLAIDAGTGDGAVLDVLAPLFARVIGVDRSEAQLALARERVRIRGYGNVELECGELEAVAAERGLARSADLVIAARMLHHAAVPRVTLRALSELVARAPGAPCLRGGEPLRRIGNGC